MAKYFYDCGGCDHYHPLGWDGDCRNDEMRFMADELPDAAIILDECAPMPPHGYRPRPGVMVGCGSAMCSACYERE